MAKSGGGQGASILFGGPPAGREAHFVLFILGIDSFFIFTFFVPFFSTSFFFLYIEQKEYTAYTRAAR